MTVTARILLACAASALALASASAKTPRTQQSQVSGTHQSDVPRDLAVHYGTLANGMHYAIMRNATPQKSASIRLRIDMGSTAEADDQQGLAHFLEHMAFNGSKAVPEGEMVKILERYGLAFGADTNASTDFTQTVYKLDLPGTSDDLIDTGLMLMREIGSELSIAPEAVDRERGIILSERRARDQFGLRQLISQIDFALPGTPVAKRLPIGTAQVIQTAPADRLRDLYRRFYTPDRALLVMVGDIDPKAIEAKIKARFGDWTGSSALEGDPVTGKVDPARTTAASYFQDKNVPTSVSIMAVTPIDTSPDTIEGRQRDLLESLANAILNRRFARIARRADTPILSGTASYDTAFSTAEMASITVSARADDWRGAIAMAEQELRRALIFGVTQAEIDEQLANYRTAYEDSARSADTRRSNALADGVVNAAETDRIVTTPAWRLELFNMLVPRINPQSVNNALTRIWSGASPLIHVSGKRPIPDAQAAILAAYSKSGAVTLVAGPETAIAPFAYTDFGPAGTIVADRRIADLDLRELRFANNVRLNIKKTDFETDRVRVSLRICCGGLELADTPGLLTFMGSSFAAGGTIAHSLDDLQSITAGRSVGLGFSGGPDAFGSSFATTPRDLELQLQILAAYLAAPGFRGEGDVQWQNFIPVYYDTLDASPGGIASRDVGRIVADDDPRFGIPPLDVLKARSMAELKAATARAFAHGAIEIGIVGDVNEQAAIDLVAKTFGALPPREPDPLPFADARKVFFSANRQPVTLDHAGKADEALDLIYWPTTDDGDAQTEAGLSLLASVMQLMLTEELRETLGATYSPNASSRTSSLYPGFGQLATSSNLDPRDIDKVEAVVNDIAASLRNKPVTDDLIKRARTPIIERIEKNKRENGTWAGLAANSQTQPRWLDRFRGARTTYEAIDAARLQALARRYLTAEGALKIRIVRAAP